MRRALLLVLALAGVSCSSVQRDAAASTALDVTGKLGVVIARGVVRAAGLCDDGPTVPLVVDGGAARDAAEGGG